MLDPIRGDMLGPSHIHGLDQKGLDRTFDICVVGSGAAGAVAAGAFVDAGLDVLVVEEGARLAAGARYRDVNRGAARALARDGGAWSERGWPWTTRNLGGGTVFYGGASFRYTPFDFDPSARIDGGDLDVRWPIGLDDLAPYYAEVESKLSVSAVPPPGEARPAGAGMPGEYLWRGAVACGHTPIPTPLAIDLSLCTACSLCICRQCDTGAKADVVRTFLSPRAGNNALSIRTGVKALALRASTRHRIDDLLCLDQETGVTRPVRARAFVVAANAIQSAALLLRSTTPFAPDGVGNRHGLVGRGLCMKLSEYSEGEAAPSAQEVAAHPVGYRGPFSTVAVLDHYLDDACPTGVGGLIYEAKHDNWASLNGRPLVLRVETIIADHPALANRVRLGSRRDRWGIPDLVIDYRADPRDLARLDYMTARSAAWLLASGARDIRREASEFSLGSTHLHGTCRAGTDPAWSVVDRTGRVHNLDNVFVADGSYMPYPGGLNPTLTIQANALRIAREIVASGVASLDAPAGARGRPTAANKAG